MAPASVQRGGAEGAESRFCLGFKMVFTISTHPALWLIDSELGGAHGCPGVGLKLRTSIFVAFCSDI